MSLDQPSRAMHRIATVRKRQELSLRTVAKRMGVGECELRREEHEATDIPLSRLYEWQEALGVPISELLIEPDNGLSPPIQQRAHLLRLMKTAASIREQTDNESVRLLVQSLVNHIVEIAPELNDVAPWPKVGSRRPANEYGRIIEREVPEDLNRGYSASA